jgi:hypothetical protein
MYLTGVAQYTLGYMGFYSYNNETDEWSLRSFKKYHSGAPIERVRFSSNGLYGAATGGGSTPLVYAFRWTGDEYEVRLIHYLHA